jgi:hypothetical protein
MKRSILFSVCACAFLLMGFVKNTHAAQYVKIESPLANIYEFLDPKSKIIRTAKKDEHYPLVFEGTLWYQIKVQDKVGWLEKKSGTVVGESTTSNAGTFIVIAILLIGTAAGVGYYIYKQKMSEA